MKHIKSALASAKQVGFTLVELMVALAAGSVLISGVGFAYLTISKTIDTSKQLENAQEVIRFSAEVYGRSFKQTLSEPVIANGTSVSVTQTIAGSTACDGSKPAVPFTEVFTFEAPNLLCDSGSGEEVILTGVAAMNIARNGNLMSVTVTPDNFQVDAWANGFRLDFALTGVILTEAMK
jgi:prepilin-type N-terminal cleavage/methylation domain-containing protein